MSNICPHLSSVIEHDLDVKGTVYLALRKDTRNFYTRFIICKNFPYQAIIGANFLKANKILLDVENSMFIYPTETKSIINNIQANKVKENIGNMKEYRNKQIREISYLWKKLENIETPGKKPAESILNSMKENNNEKYYGFAVRKTKIPPKSMQRVQISQMLEPINDKNEIWVASPLEDIPKYITCEEQIINYEKGEDYIWVTNTLASDMITLSKGTCLVEIQVVSETDINNWKKAEKNLVNNINIKVDKEYHLTRIQFLEKFELNHITDIPLKQKLCDLLWQYKNVFSTSEDDIGLIPFINTQYKLRGCQWQNNLTVFLINIRNSQ